MIPRCPDCDIPVYFRRHLMDIEAPHYACFRCGTAWKPETIEQTTVQQRITSRIQALYRRIDRERYEKRHGWQDRTARVSAAIGRLDTWLKAHT